MVVAQCFEVAKARCAWKRRIAVQEIERTRSVPEEWKACDNRFCAMLIRAWQDQVGKKSVHISSMI
eukprot:8044256-Prorocentrum_lima.AAC.1